MFWSLTFGGKDESARLVQQLFTSQVVLAELRKVHLVRSMHRFYLPPGQSRGQLLTLQDGEAHHAIHVLRVRKGETLSVLDGEGQELLCEVADVAKKLVSLNVRERKDVPPLPYELTLFQAIPKGKTMDLIVQKATELGVRRIVPILSERVTVQLEGERIEDKRDKWQHVAIEAIKQCGQRWLPRVETPCSLAEGLRTYKDLDFSLVGSLQPGSRHPREFINAYITERKAPPRTVAIWVGPEGDLTASEIATLTSNGVLPITLGRLVLRCETAAIYCLSVMNHELQVLNSEKKV